MRNRVLKRGLLVVARIDYEARGQIVARQPLPGLSMREVTKRYMGIDGELWPGKDRAAGVELERGLAPLEQLDRVRAYHQSVQRAPRADLLLVERDLREEVSSQGELRFLGFDFGFLESEDNVYSFLFHEIIYPRFPKFSALGSRLNDHLLLRSFSETIEVAETMDALEVIGERFETTDSTETCVPFAIYSVGE